MQSSENESVVPTDDDVVARLKWRAQLGALVIGAVAVSCLVSLSRVRSTGEWNTSHENLDMPELNSARLQAANDRPTDSPTTRPTEAPVAQSMDSPTARLTDSLIARPTDAPVARPTDSPMARPTVYRPTDRTTAKVLRVLHVSGNGGTTMCELVHRNKHLTLPVDPHAQDHNCNAIGSGPNWLNYKQRPPDGQLWRKCGWSPTQEKRKQPALFSSRAQSTCAVGVFFMEIGLDAEAPCEDTIDVMLIREPWSRAHSLMNKMWHTLANRSVANHVSARPRRFKCV